MVGMLSFMVNERTETFLPPESTADRLGVPVAWLRREAQAGRIPHLKAGRRILFNPELVERVLLERTAGKEASPA
jgi:excisionase family DNA binding protein